MNNFRINLSLSSCKKGEDDPFLSLNSREKRIRGEWKVSTAEIRYINQADNPYYEQYNETKVFVYWSDDYYNYTGEGTYYWNYDIRKNGTYTITKSINVIHYKSQKSTEEGIWYFLDKNKDAGYKNKECIAFQPQKYTYNNIVQYEGENINPDVYQIIELRDKLVSMKRTYSYERNQTSNDYKMSLDEMITMIPQSQDF